MVALQERVSFADGLEGVIVMVPLGAVFWTSHFPLGDQENPLQQIVLGVPHASPVLPHCVQLHPAASQSALLPSRSLHGWAPPSGRQELPLSRQPGATAQQDDVK